MTAGVRLMHVERTKAKGRHGVTDDFRITNYHHLQTRRIQMTAGHPLYVIGSNSSDAIPVAVEVIDWQTEYLHAGQAASHRRSAFEPERENTHKITDCQ